MKKDDPLCRIVGMADAEELCRRGENTEPRIEKIGEQIIDNPMTNYREILIDIARANEPKIIGYSVEGKPAKKLTVGFYRVLK